MPASLDYNIVISIVMKTRRSNSTPFTLYNLKKIIPRPPTDIKSHVADFFNILLLILPTVWTDVTRKEGPFLFYVYRSEVACRGRGGGGGTRVKARPWIPPEKDRRDRGPLPEVTMAVLMRCPLATAQRLVHCAIAVSTAVLGQSQRQCPLHCCWRTTPRSERSPTFAAQFHLPTHDLFWANLKVQLHLSHPLRFLDLLISPGTLWAHAEPPENQLKARNTMNYSTNHSRSLAMNSPIFRAMIYPNWGNSANTWFHGDDTGYTGTAVLIC